MSTLARLVEGDKPPLVAFKPLLVASLVFALLVCAISLPLLWDHWPVNAAVAGGALSWPIAVALAWLGQSRQKRHS